MRLGLGTAQFGTDYGVTNTNGRVSEEEVARILSLAKEAKISVLDTAQAYGQSEYVLGRQLKRNHGFRIVTKTAQLSEYHPDHLAAEFQVKFKRSLERLGQTSIYALLAHDCASLIGQAGPVLWAEMQNLRQQGLVQKIGVSVYNANQIALIIDTYDLDIIQIPINLMDQRLKQAGELIRLRSRGIEIHARSIFLQGILLAKPENLNQRFDGLREHLSRTQAYLSEQGLAPLAGAIGYALQCQEIGTILVGVCRENELRDILSAMDNVGNIAVDYSPCAFDDDQYLNPSRWDELPTNEKKGVFLAK